jgi:hypothetical protein
VDLDSSPVLSTQPGPGFEAAALDRLRRRLIEHAAKHGSAHPAYHKHCHLHPDDICQDCQWLKELLAIIDS